MARIKPIRISENDRKEYARLVRNARAKVKRTKKKHNIDLSDEITLPSIEEFSTRDEFNTWKEKTSSFTNRYNLNYQFVTNEYNVTASKKTLNEIERRRKREQRVATEEAERVLERQVKQGGKPFATVEQRTTHFSLPDVTGVNIPKDFNFKDIKSQRRLDEIIEVGKSRVDPEYYDKRKWRMQQNFMKGLEESFDSEADDLIDEIGQMHPDDFYFLYIENVEFDFKEFFYKSDEIEVREGHVGKMHDLLKKYQEEVFDKNGDLKNF